MKRRTPGSQVMAQTVWILSLQNPKLGACKFAPVLVGMGGSASREVWGLAGTWHLLSLDVMGTESAGWCRAGRDAAKTGVVVLGGSALSWVPHAPRAHSRAVPCCHHQTQREAGIPHPPWGGSSPPQPLSALSAVLGCGIRAAAKNPPHPAAPEPGKSSTHWTRSWSQRERARQGPAPLTEPRHHSDPTGTGAGSGLAAELPGSSSSSGFKSSTAALALPRAVVVAKPQRGQIPANPLGHLDVGCQPGMGQLSTSGHLCPPATLSLCPWLNYRGSLTAVPPPHCSLLAAQHGGGLHPLPAPHPKRDPWIFPSTGGSWQTPLLTAQDSIAPSCSVGVFYLTPFCLYLPSPCDVKVQLGCPGVTTRLGGAEHTALGVQVLPWLGAVRIGTTRATPALFRYRVNQFCTGTSSCHYWDLADWNNPCVHGGELVPLRSGTFYL